MVSAGAGDPALCLPRAPRWSPVLCCCPCMSCGDVSPPRVLGHVLSGRNALGPSRSCRYAYVEYLGMRTMILSLQTLPQRGGEEGLGFQFALGDI